MRKDTRNVVGEGIFLKLKIGLAINNKINILNHKQH